MTLIKVTPDNRGNLGPPADNLPVFSRDINPVIKAVEELQNSGGGGGGIFLPDSKGTMMNDIFVRYTDIAAETSETTLFQIFLNKGNISSISAPNLLSITGEVSINALIITSISLQLLETIAAGFSVTGCNLLEEILLNSLVEIGGVLNIGSNPILPELNIPLLETVGDQILIDSNSAMTGVDLHSLETADSSIQISSNALLQSINLSGLISCTALTISSNQELAGVDLSLFQTCESLSIAGNELTTLLLTALVGVSGSITVEETNLTTVEITDSLHCLNISFANSALSQASVNHILTQLDAAGFTDGVLNLSGGTNASPSGAGSTAKTNLEGKNWVIQVN